MAATERETGHPELSALGPPPTDAAAARAELEKLFASVDLESIELGAVPLVTADLSVPRRPEKAAATADVESVPRAPRSKVARLIGTVDLFLEKIEPALTGDFLFPRDSADVVASPAPKPARPAGAADELLVGRVLGDVDIIVDVHDLLHGSAGLERVVLSGSTDVAPSVDLSVDVPIALVDLPVAGGATVQIPEVDLPTEELEQPSTDELFLASAPTIDYAGVKASRRLHAVAARRPQPVQSDLDAIVVHDLEVHSETVDAPREYRPEDVAEAQVPIEAAAGAFASALRLLEEKDLQAAYVILARLEREHPEVSDHVATASWARFLLESDDRARFVEATRLCEHAATHPFCLTTHARLGRMFLEMHRPMAAVRFLRRATELAPERSDLLQDLVLANELVALKKSDRSVALEDVAEDTGADLRRSARLAKLDARRLPIVLSLVALVIAAAHVAAIELGLGRFEAWLDPTDPFFWGRRVVVLVTGLLGAWGLYRHRPITQRELELAPTALAISLLVGAIAGATADVHVGRYPAATVGFLMVFQVLAEESFFRVFLGRALERGLVGIVTPALLSGLLYTAYVLTSSASWQALGTFGGLSRVVPAAFLTGTAYALLHRSSRSLVPPLVAHLTAALVLASASGR